MSPIKKSIDLESRKVDKNIKYREIPARTGKTYSETAGAYQNLKENLESTSFDVRGEDVIISPKDRPSVNIPKTYEHKNLTKGAGGLNPAQKMDIALRVVALADNIVSSIRDMYTAYQHTRQEIEKTKQVQAMAQAKIKEEEEVTNRVYIQETEATKRFKIQTEKELKEMQGELEKFRMQLSLENKKLDNDYYKFQKRLENLRYLASSVKKHYDILNSRMIESFSRGEKVDEGISRDMENLGNRLLEFARLVNLLG